MQFVIPLEVPVFQMQMVEEKHGNRQDAKNPAVPTRSSLDASKRQQQHSAKGARECIQKKV
jgi:hypothetical protein